MFVTGSSSSGTQPASWSGFDPPPVIAPMPALYDNPISVRYSPMPVPQAILRAPSS
jgi:hypothetical protein